MTQKTKGQSGFGIVEVVVSLGLLSTVILATNFLSSLASKAWESSQNKTVAHGLIQRSFEELRLKRDFNNHLGDPFDQGVERYEEVYALESTPAKKYNIEVDIYDEPALIGGDTYNGISKKAKVKISWSERSGEKNIEAVTYLTDWRPRY